MKILVPPVPACIGAASRPRSGNYSKASFHHNEALQGANMKLAFFDNYKLGVVVGDKIVDVSAVS
jgi:hypothetical protein